MMRLSLVAYPQSFFSYLNALLLQTLYNIVQIQLKRIASLNEDIYLICE